MKQIGTWLSVLAFVMGAMALAGGTAVAQPPANPDVELDCEEPPAGFTCASETGGSFTYDIISEPGVLNPVTTQDTASGDAIDHVIGGAVFGDYSLLGDLDDPQAAEMLELNEAGNVLTARLREGLQYSDGSTATTQDIQYWYYNVVWNPNTPNSLTDVYTCPSGQAYQLEIMNDRELQFGCPNSEPFRTFADNASGLFVLSEEMARGFIDSQGISTNQAIAPGPDGVLDTEPAGDDQNFEDVGAVIVPGENGTLDTEPSGDDVVIEQATEEFMGLGIDATEIRGLGPYRFTTFQSDSVARYERNPNFYEVDSNGTQLPYLDEMSVLFVDDQNVSLANFRDGSTDAFAPRPQDLSTLRSRQAQGGFPLNENIDSGNATTGTEFVALNWQDTDRNLASANRNANVRKAMSLAVDRVALVNNVLLGIGTPQYSPNAIPALGSGNNFFLGRNNTCQDFIDAGLSTPDTCSDGTWTVRDNLELDVTQLPAPDTPAIVQHLECLTDYEGCLDEARSLLDEAGVTDSDGDDVREIPADFGSVYDNSGGPLQIQLTTNTGNTTREGFNEIVCEGLNRVGIGCQTTTTAFPTLVDQLLTGEWSGGINIGLTGNDPAGAVNVVPCGGALHLYHVGCDPEATEGPNAPTDTEVALENAWVPGFNAENVEEAQEAFDEWQRIFLEREPYFHTATQNALFAVRTDRVCNDGRSVGFNDDVKFRTDIEGQTECPR